MYQWQATDHVCNVDFVAVCLDLNINVNIQVNGKTVAELSKLLNAEEQK